MGPNWQCRRQSADSHLWQEREPSVLCGPDRIVLRNNIRRQITAISSRTAHQPIFILQSAAACWSPTRVSFAFTPEDPPMLIMRVSGAIARGILIFKTSLRLHRDRAALSLMAAEFQRTKVLKAVYSGSVRTADENIEAEIGAGARQTHVCSARNCTARGSNNVLSEICKQADACVEAKTRSDKGLGPHLGTHEIGLQRKISAGSSLCRAVKPDQKDCQTVPFASRALPKANIFYAPLAELHYHRQTIQLVPSSRRQTDRLRTSPHEVFLTASDANQCDSPETQSSDLICSTYPRAASSECATEANVHDGCGWTGEPC